MIETNKIICPGCGAELDVENLAAEYPPSVTAESTMITDDAPDSGASSRPSTKKRNRYFRDDT